MMPNYNDPPTYEELRLIELEKQLTALQGLRAEGVLETRFGDDWVRFKSDRELKAAITDIQAEIARLQGRAPAQSFVIRSNKGW